MYAVIRAGGKQHKVSPGDVIEIERLKEAGDTVAFTPLFVVADDGTTLSDKAELAKARVVGSVVGEAKGPKVEVFKYRSKSRYRQRQGHRQRYTTIKISEITLPGKQPAAAEPKESSDGA